MGLLAVHEELGGLRVGLERVGGDHGAGEVEAVKQRGEGGDLTRRAGYLALGQHRAGGVVHRGQQMDLPAAWGAGAAQGLAVDRDRPWPPVGALPVAVGQPGADRGGQGLGVKPGKGAPDRGFAGDRPHPVAGARIAAVMLGVLGGLLVAQVPVPDTLFLVWLLLLVVGGRSAVRVWSARHRRQVADK